MKERAGRIGLPSAVYLRIKTPLSPGALENRQGEYLGWECEKNLFSTPMTASAPGFQGSFTNGVCQVVVKRLLHPLQMGRKAGETQLTAELVKGLAGQDTVPVPSFAEKCDLKTPAWVSPQSSASQKRYVSPKLQKLQLEVME